VQNKKRPRSIVGPNSKERLFELGAVKPPNKRRVEVAKVLEPRSQSPFPSVYNPKAAHS
jgi:hypothetical protein